MLGRGTQWINLRPAGLAQAREKAGAPEGGARSLEKGGTSIRGDVILFRKGWHLYLAAPLSRRAISLASDVPARERTANSFYRVVPNLVVPAGRHKKRDGYPACSRR